MKMQLWWNLTSRPCLEKQKQLHSGLESTVISTILIVHLTLCNRKDYLIIK